MHARSAVLVIVVVFIAFLTPAALGVDRDELVKQIKNPSAQKAVDSYQQEVGKATERFNAELAALRKTLLTKLEAAQSEETKANRLDEAVLLRDLRKEYESDAKTPAPAPSAPVQIVAALYGQNVNWIDVTDKVRTAYGKGKPKWSTIVDTKELGEPAPNWNGQRTLIVRYTVSGKPHIKFVYEGSRISIP